MAYEKPFLTYIGVTSQAPSLIFKSTEYGKIFSSMNITIDQTSDSEYNGMFEFGDGIYIGFWIFGLIYPIVLALLTWNIFA